MVLKAGGPERRRGPPHKHARTGRGEPVFREGAPLPGPPATPPPRFDVRLRTCARDGQGCPRRRSRPRAPWGSGAPSLRSGRAPGAPFQPKRPPQLLPRGDERTLPPPPPLGPTLAGPLGAAAQQAEEEEEKREPPGPRHGAGIPLLETSCSPTGRSLFAQPGLWRWRPRQGSPSFANPSWRCGRGEQWAAALPRLLPAPRKKAGAQPELFATEPI